MKVEPRQRGFTQNQRDEDPEPLSDQVVTHGDGVYREAEHVVKEYRRRDGRDARDETHLDPLHRIRRD